MVFSSKIPSSTSLLGLGGERERHTSGSASPLWRNRRSWGYLASWKYTSEETDVLAVAQAQTTIKVRASDLARRRFKRLAVAINTGVKRIRCLDSVGQASDVELRAVGTDAFLTQTS